MYKTIHGKKSEKPQPFLYLTTGAPGNTHDACLLKHKSLFKEMPNGERIPNQSISLGDLGLIQLITIGDAVFRWLQWFIKSSGSTQDQKERFFNEKLCSARVITENLYGILKERWQLIYKKSKCQLKNVKSIIMAAFFFNNLCISMNEPWKPRWKLSTEQLKLFDEETSWIENKQRKQRSCEAADIISNWLLNNH